METVTVTKSRALLNVEWKPLLRQNLENLSLKIVVSSMQDLLCLLHRQYIFLNCLACSGMCTKKLWGTIENEYFALRWHQLVGRTLCKWKMSNNSFDQGPVWLAGYLYKTSFLWLALSTGCQAKSLRVHTDGAESIVLHWVYAHWVDGSLLLSVLSARR